MTGVFAPPTPEPRLLHSLIAKSVTMLSDSNTQNCLILAAITIAMSIMNSSWLYTPLGYLDPWINVGYFLHYADPQFGGDSYKIARLSWLMPGFILYHTFDPLVGNYLLHVGYLIASVLLFYLTVARLLGSAVAVAVSACLAIFTPFHGSGGWDYQNTGAGAYYFLSFYLLTRASLSGKTRSFLWVGVGYAATVHASIVFINIFPILVLHSLIVYRCQFGVFPRLQQAVSAALWFILGAVALTLLLSLVNAGTGREFLFFQPLINLVTSFLSDNRNQTSWWLPWSSHWFLQLSELNYVRVLFAVLFVCVVSVTFGLVRRNLRPVALSLQLQYIFVAVVWIVWQTAGQTALVPQYFAYPLYPAMFFALAGLAATWQSCADREQATFLYSGMLGSAAVLSLSISSFGDTVLHWVDSHVEMWLAASALVFVVLFRISGPRRVFLLGAFIAFCASNALGIAATGNGGPYSFGSVCNDRGGDAFHAIIDDHAFLYPLIRNSNDLFFWWNKNETVTDSAGCSRPIASFALSLEYSGLWQYLAAPWDGMPEPDELPASSISAIAGSKRLAIVTADPANVQRIIARFGGGGVKLSVEKQARIRTSQSDAGLYVLRPDSERQFSGARINISLENLQPYSGANLLRSDAAVTITNLRQRWAYGAIIPLELPKGAIGPGVVHVRLQVGAGRVGVGVLGRGDAAPFLIERPVAVADGLTDLYLDLADVAKAGPLIFRSWSANTEVRARIVAIEVILGPEGQSKS
jgi:hypothetical protein